MSARSMRNQHCFIKSANRTTDLLSPFLVGSRVSCAEGHRAVVSSDHEGRSEGYSRGKQRMTMLKETRVNMGLKARLSEQSTKVDTVGVTIVAD